MAAMPEVVPRSPQPYRTPELLQDIRLLDLLELSGTTVKASRLLNLSQPTVSRRYRLLAQDFGLERQSRQLKGCRYGSSVTLRYLRLGYRAHRLEAGLARVGTDLMHHHLLSDCDGLLPVPLQFRSIEQWAELVHQGVLDAALISGLELEAAAQPVSSRVQLQELGAMPLALAASGRSIRSVLVPHRSVAAGLHQRLLRQGLTLKALGNLDLPPREWLRRLAVDPSGLMLDRSCCAPGAWAEELKVLPLAQHLYSPVWFLQPRCEQLPVVLKRIIDQICSRLESARHATSQASSVEQILCS